MLTRAGVHRWSLLGVVVVGGCVASQGVSPRQTTENRQFSRIEDAVAALKTDDAENGESGKARVRLTVLGTPGAARYVDATFRVPDDEFVMVVAIDLDRRVRVVFPEKPEESGYVTRDNSTEVTRFFAGFGHATNLGRYSNAYSLSEPITRYSGGGVLLAIASDKPLQFDRFRRDDGDWNEELLERVVFDVSAPTAARALGKALTVTGQEFGLDYSTFRPSNSVIASFASNSFDNCVAFNDALFNGSAVSYLSSYSAYTSDAPVVYFTQNGVTYVQYQSGSRCGRMLYSAPVPIQLHPGMPRDTTHSDSLSTAAFRAARANRAAPSTTEARAPGSADPTIKRPVRERPQPRAEAGGTGGSGGTPIRPDPIR